MQKTNRLFENIEKLLGETKSFPTPFFLVDETLIENNLKILQHVKNKSGAKILLAQKAFSCYDTYPLIEKYLDGTTASGLYEAKLANEHFNGENHVFAPSFSDRDIKEIAKICTHIVFNSVTQLNYHYEFVKSNGLSVSLRLNPQHSTQDGGIYDPCAPHSRFGTLASNDFFNQPDTHKMLDGLHFHTLCQQGFKDLESTFDVFEKRFGEFFKKLCNHKTRNHKTYLNLGGGHHITRDDYDLDGIIKLIKKIRQTYDCDIYLEPGEAVVLNSGYLISSIMDIVNNDGGIVIMDTSAACHNPDIIETQHSYVPKIFDAKNVDLKSIRNERIYRLAGNTCLSGDIIGDYEFEKKLDVGDRLVFSDMALYTIVKGNTFNGIPLPSIYIRRLGGEIELLRQPHYLDFKSRLGK
ncbi:MAG: carboxynorspermidine decarboxylase [Firmicutes bacterium]|nr:carboxynorspermidine decarboxylase [Bacillota bacterium]